MRPSARHLQQHRFIVRQPQNAKIELLPLIKKCRDNMLAKTIPHFNKLSDSLIIPDQV